MLLNWKCGGHDTLHVLLPLVYSELRRLAQHHLRGERVDHTLQSTALVDEAFLRLVKAGSLPIESRGHFFALASQLMREILVDYPRSHSAAKRDAGSRLTLDPAAELSKTKGVDLLPAPHGGIDVLWWVVHRRDLRVSGCLVGYRRTRVGRGSSMVISRDQQDQTP